MSENTIDGEAMIAAVTANTEFACYDKDSTQRTKKTSAALILAYCNLTRSVTTIGSSATNTTQTMLSYTLPASTMTATQPGIMVTAFGHKAANAAPVTLQLNVGGTNINTGSLTQNGTTWMLTAQVIRSASNTQQELYTAQFGTVLLAPKSTSDTSVDTNTIAISVQALDASAAQSNVLLDGLIVEYFN
jgi:hypothetical protein